MRVLLLKYGEIALKGLNRAKFEKLLIQNLRAALLKCAESYDLNADKFVLEREQSALTLWYDEPGGGEFDIDCVIPAVSKVFGIILINPAIRVTKDIPEITGAALKYIAPVLEGRNSFGVTAKRSDKTFALKSPELAALVGDVLFEHHKNIKVDLKNPEIWVTVEIRANGAFLHSSALKIRGAGGIPTGSGGVGLLLLSGGIDSPVAGYMTARRGMKIAALHFTSEPYTSAASRQKVIRLAGLLEEYAGRIKFYSVSLTEIQEHIKKYCDGDYTTVILRRFMMQIAERIAEKYFYDCLITGESLGQVASQTIQAISAVNHGIKLPVFRPCIGLDKYQIIEIAERIGTYETSIEPYDDCCALFTPRHPVTRPKLYKVLHEENRIEQSGMSKHELISRALERMEII
ncbi:MAG: tRNA 4-thiouridine(8) synthase ThiI [Oscillospiraceae bacterium]|nr:tRNA 4-thiouridine(8) synthase ThiI [Oscillospiraceae bacterium]